MYKSVVLVHSDGERFPLLVDERGFPYVLPNIFALTQRGLAWRTIKKKLISISKLYEWAYSLSIDIQLRIEYGQLFSEAEINGSLFTAIRTSHSKNKVQKIAVGAKTFNTHMMYIREYMQWLFNSYLMSLPSTDRRFDAFQKKQKIISGWLYDARLSISSAENEVNKGLSQVQQNLLLVLTNPDSYDNPWKSEDIRQRNHIIIQLMINFGLRPAELLTLRVTDLDFGSVSQLNIMRRPHDVDDPRTESPEVKRSGRIMPILDPDLAETLDNYIVNWRYKFDDKHKTGTSFLILSDEGRPLSYASITKIFSCLKSKECRLPANLSAKSLRHTFSYNMEKSMRARGIEEIRRAEILQYLRGDISQDSQKIYIKEAIKEESRSALKFHQSQILALSRSIDGTPF